MLKPYSLSRVLSQETTDCMPPVHKTDKAVDKSNVTQSDPSGVSTNAALRVNFAKRNLFFFKKQVIYQGPICHAYSDMVEKMVGQPFKPSSQTDFFKWLVEQEPRFSSLDLSVLKETAILSFHRLQVSVKKKSQVFQVFWSIKVRPLVCVMNTEPLIG